MRKEQQRKLLRRIKKENTESAKKLARQWALERVQEMKRKSLLTNPIVVVIAASVARLPVAEPVQNQDFPRYLPYSVWFDISTNLPLRTISVGAQQVIQDWECEKSNLLKNVTDINMR